MKRRITTTITTLAMAAAMLMLVAPAALAEEGPETGCPVGTANSDSAQVGEWELLSQAEFAALLMDEYGYTDFEAADQRATLTYDFCDKNDDGYACVMKQNLPAGGGSHWLAEDNHKR